MSENNVDSNLKQTIPNLGHVSPRMGNLFSKEELEDQHSSKDGLPADNPQPIPISPGNDLLMRHQEHFFKFFDRVGIGRLLQGYDETQVLESEKIILNAFLNEVRTSKPAAQRNWSALRHYIYFIYRHVISSKPCNSSEIFHNVITKKIRDLIDSLLQEDFTQFCLRLVMLVREYAVIARGHFDNFQFPKVTAYLVSLMSYYSAFCSAASKLAPLLPEFDFLIMERFNVNWLCLNKSIFYHYFYMSASVQAKIPEFVKLKDEGKTSDKNLLETYACFTEDMTLLATRWSTLKIRIGSLIQKRNVQNSEKHHLTEHKNILKSNYWIVRSVEEMQLQDLTELDAHILALVGDTDNVIDLLIDSQGHCLCEDCLTAEFRASSVTAPIVPSPFEGLPPAQCRLITCYICQDPVALDGFISHIVTKHQDSPVQKPTRVYLTPHQKRLFCPKKSLKHSDAAKAREVFPFDGLFEKNIELKESILKMVQGRTVVKSGSDNSFRIEESKETEELKHKTPRVNDSHFPNNNNPTSPIFQSPGESSSIFVKEPVLKVATKAPVMQNGDEIVFKSASKPKEDMWSCKTIFDDYIKMRNENETQFVKNSFGDAIKWKSTDAANKKATEILKRTSELFNNNKDGSRSVSEKVTANEVTQKKSLGSTNSSVNISTSDLNAAFRKPQQKNTVDPKMFEFLKNSNVSKSLNSLTKSDNACLGHACGHKCKQDDDKQDAKKHTCQDSTDHHKESRKCECTYCEVFGTNLLSQTNKTNETRDRLRTRLIQRKEKVVEHSGKASKLLLAQTSKTSIGNEKTPNGTKLKPLPNETDQRVPPSEVHSVTPPSFVEPKRSSTVPPGSAQKVTTSLCGGGGGSSTDFDIAGSLPTWSLSTSSASSLILTKPRSSSIEDLLQFIEGPVKRTAPPPLPTKKISKKARQRLRKAQERERLEKERLEEEERLKQAKSKEEERLKAEALAKQLTDKQKKTKKEKEPLKSQPKPAESKKNSRKKTKGDDAGLIEETIPAMVTIKRVAEGNNSQATVTITLKGSTPESDKLLLTLVDGHNKERVATALINTEKKVSKTKTESSLKVVQPQLKQQNSSNNNNNDNKKKKKEQQTVTNSKENKVKQVKVTIAVDKSNTEKKGTASKKSTTAKSNHVTKPTNNIQVVKEQSPRSLTRHTTPTPKNDNRDDINLPMLRLPPGITITKIEGPPTNRNCKVSNGGSVNSLSHPNPHQNPNVPVSKSGVIVVDTEKLIQQSITASNDKKNRKKNKKKQQRELKNSGSSTESGNKGVTINGNGPTSMVTLKNPIFHTLQSTLNTRPPASSSEQTELPVFPNGNRRASIFKNENGMVTIRSPRLQNSFENGAPITDFITDLKPMFGPEITGGPYVPVCHNSFSECTENTTTTTSSFDAQEILSGLPGIEITKVDKSSAPKNESEHKKVSQPAEVSIIATSNSANGTDKFNFDRDDWPFESVFTPKDVLEDDMDAEERELEAFKRFCQQSVPPERKEKVAHLNVKDIVLKKKNDVTYS